jgi:hypothetical protein
MGLGMTIRNAVLSLGVPTYAMFTHFAFMAVRNFVAREDGDTMSQVVWSVGFILLVGVIAVVIGPSIGADWREFVGKPTR